jgi:hypothetical protein
VSDATAALDAMIASVRKMETLVADSMPALTAAVRGEVERTIAGGTDAYGQKWEPTKKGERPLQHAAAAVTVMSVNRTIFVQVSGVEARHHLGHVKGGRKRAIIPDRGELPDTMANSLRSVIEQAFKNAVAQ